MLPSLLAFSLLIIFILTFAKAMNPTRFNRDDVLYLEKSLPSEISSNSSLKASTFLENRTTAEASITAITPIPLSLVPTVPSSAKKRVDREPLNQFFVFGLLVGVVCTISLCTCIFKPRLSSTPSAGGGSTNLNDSLGRLFRIKEPFETNKPYRLNFDDNGLCYASPLADNEIPPLPSYLEACMIPANPFLEASSNLNEVKQPPLFPKKALLSKALSEPLNV